MTLMSQYFLGRHTAWPVYPDSQKIDSYELFFFSGLKTYSVTSKIIFPNEGTEVLWKLAG